MGKTKKVGLIARALTCLAATAAIVLGTAFPAFAWDEPDGSVLDRKINAALMDKASGGGTDMLKLGFKFSEKALHMFGVFSGCSSLTNLDGLSEWNTSGVTKMIRMFSGCSSLTTLGDISGWDTSKMTNIQNMFADASSLKADCSKWPISEEAWRTRYGFNRNTPGVISPVRQ